MLACGRHEQSCMVKTCKATAERTRHSKERQLGADPVVRDALRLHAPVAFCRPLSHLAARSKTISVRASRAVFALARPCMPHAPPHALGMHSQGDAACKTGRQARGKAGTRESSVTIMCGTVTAFNPMKITCTCVYTRNQRAALMHGLPSPTDPVPRDQLWPTGPVQGQ